MWRTLSEVGVVEDPGIFNPIESNVWGAMNEYRVTGRIVIFSSSRRMFGLIGIDKTPGSPNPI